MPSVIYSMLHSVIGNVFKVCLENLILRILQPWIPTDRFVGGTKIPSLVFQEIRKLARELEEAKSLVTQTKESWLADKRRWELEAEKAKVIVQNSKFPRVRIPQMDGLPFIYDDGNCFIDQKREKSLPRCNAHKKS